MASHSDSAKRRTSPGNGRATQQRRPATGDDKPLPHPQKATLKSLTPV